MEIHKIKQQINLSEIYHDYVIWQKGKIKIAPHSHKRHKYLRSTIRKLRKNGIKIQDNNSTFYLRKMSPGCHSCMQGKYVCLWLTYLCNKNCFFCSRARDVKVAKLASSNFSNGRPLHKVQNHKYYYNPNITPHANSRVIFSDSALLEELHDHNCEVFGISGGEPLLKSEQALKYIKLIRNNFGNNFRTHIFTNGTVCNENILKDLKLLKLTEIRFNLEATKTYDLKPLLLAKKYIPDVTVEIPVIPNHENKLKKLILKLDKIGVKYLNLHELAFTQSNIKQMLRYGFKLKCENLVPYYRHDLSPVAGSEEVAFRLLLYAAKHTKNIAVHYCSSSARQNTQIINRWKNLAKNRKHDYEVVTSEGLLEKGIIYGQPINNIIKHLKILKIKKNNIKINTLNNLAEIHPNLTKTINIPKCQKAITSRVPTTLQTVKIKLL